LPRFSSGCTRLQRRAQRANEVCLCALILPILTMLTVVFASLVPPPSLSPTNHSDRARGFVRAAVANTSRSRRSLPSANMRNTRAATSPAARVPSLSRSLSCLTGPSSASASTSAASNLQTPHPAADAGVTRRAAAPRMCSSVTAEPPASASAVGSGGPS
jgi:hypothetical protein